MRWPLDKFDITQEYSSGHPALDLGGNSVGTPIKAPETGTIVAVNNDPNAYYGGLYVVVQGDSGYRHYLGHNSVNYVSPGQRVLEGERIAAIGASGFAVQSKGIPAPSGPHTHYEVSRNWQTVNPHVLKQLGDDMFEGKSAQQWAAEKKVATKIADTRAKYLAMLALAAGVNPDKAIELPDVERAVKLIDDRNKAIANLKKQVEKVGDSKAVEALKAIKEALKEV